MKRRDFLRAAAMAGLAVTTPLSLTPRARAEEIGSYDGPLWITINCDGGWDPTMVCDPKGNSVNQSFAAPCHCHFSSFRGQAHCYCLA